MDKVRPTTGPVSFEVESGTDDARVVVSIHGRETPTATDFWDGNWLRATISVHVRAMMEAAFDAQVDASLRSDEIDNFRTEVEHLVGGNGKVARFESMEEWLCLQITEGDHGWLVTGHVSDQPATGSTLKFRLSEVEQRQLRDLLRQLTDVLDTYEVIGAPDNP